MRYVITRDFTPDLGKDARNSHFEGTPTKPIIIKGDFSHDFRNVSVAHAIIEGDWSQAKIRYLTSFMSDWSGCILPSDVSSLDHDHVMGIVQRRLPELALADKQAAEIVYQNVAASYFNSWLDSEFQLVEAGIAPSEIRRIFGILFKGYPDLLNRLKDTLDGKEGERSAIPIQKRPIPNLLQTNTEIVDLDRDPRVKGEDRWAIAEKLSSPDLGVWIRTMHPFPRATAALRDGLDDGWRFA